MAERYYGRFPTCGRKEIRPVAERNKVGGWGVSPTGKSYSFRSCVRASEAACGRETTLLPMLGFGRKQRAATSFRVPFPSPSQNHSLAVCWLTNRCKSLLIDSKSFRVASRCFSLLPAAFPLRLGWKTANLYVWTPGVSCHACLLAC